MAFENSAVLSSFSEDKQLLLEFELYCIGLRRVLKGVGFFFFVDVFINTFLCVCQSQLRLYGFKNSLQSRMSSPLEERNRNFFPFLFPVKKCCPCKLRAICWHSNVETVLAVLFNKIWVKKESL